MPQLGKLAFVVLDSTGAPASGATLVIRKQGASINGNQGGSPYTVDDTGAIVTGDNCIVYNRSLGTESSTGAATINSSTQIAVSGLGAVAATDNDRISTTSPLPTIYEDVIGNESIVGSTLSTDAEGYAECYVQVGFYDVKKSGAGISTRLYIDQAAVGGSKHIVYVFDNSSAIGYLFDVRDETGGTLSTAGAKLLSIQNGGVEKVSVDKDGKLTLAGALAVAGATTFTGALTASAGFTLSAGTLSLPAGSISGPVFDDDTADYSITNTITAIPNVTKAVTPASTTSFVFVIATIPWEYTSGATANFLTAQLLEDATVLQEATNAAYSTITANSGGVFTLMALRTGFNTSRTYTVKIGKDSGAGVYKVVNSGDRKARIIAIELKF